MPVFEVATHRNDLAMDIETCGEKQDVRTTLDAQRAAMYLPSDSHPYVGFHIDGECVEQEYFFKLLMQEEKQRQLED